MKASDLVFNSVYKGALAAGAKERNAKDFAVLAMDDYKKNKFKSINNLIKKRIKEALK